MEEVNNNEKRLPAKSFQDLVVWQKAHEVTLLIYKLTRDFPREERYGFTAQFRRAAISIAANIAEGFIKKSDIEKIRYFNISQGSLEECKYYSILSKDLGYGEDNELNDKYVETGKLLYAFIKKLKHNSKS